MPGPTIVQSNVAAVAAGAHTLAFLSNNALNNAIVVVVAGVSVGTGGVGDTNGNAYTNNTATSASGNFQLSLSYATRIKAGANTVNVNLASAGRVWIAEIGRPAGNIAPEIDILVTNATGTTANPSVAAGSTRYPDELTIAAFTGNATVAPSAGASWTPLDTTLIAAGIVDLIEDQTFATLGTAVTATGTGVAAASSGQWAGQVISFFSDPFGTNFVAPRELQVTGATELNTPDQKHGSYASVFDAADQDRGPSNFAGIRENLIASALTLNVPSQSHGTYIYPLDPTRETERGNTLYFIVCNGTGTLPVPH